MSEAEKKARATSGQPETGDRGATIKPFPDFIAAPAQPGGIAPGVVPVAPIQAGGALGGGGMSAASAPSSSTGAPTGSASPPPPSSPTGGGSGQSLPPPPAPRSKTPPPPRARGGGWAFLFALVSVAAAGVSLSGPSIRPIAAEKLRQQFGDQEWIGIVTGTADTRPPSVIQLDLAAFDRRLDALAQTLTTANPGAPVDGETLARFADAAGAKSEIAALESSLRSARSADEERDATLSGAVGGMEAQVAELTRRADELDGGVAGLTEGLRAVEAGTGKALELAEGADTASKELATTLGGLMPRLEQAEAGLAALTSQLEAVRAGVGERVTAALTPALEPIGRRLDALDARADAIAAGIGAALEPINARIAALDEGARASIAEATAALAALREELTATRSGVQALDGKLEALEAAGAVRQGAVDALERKLEANTAVAGALAGRVGEVEEALKRQAGATGSALLGLTNRVRIAVDEGEGYAPELSVIRTLATGDARYDAPLTVLATMAERGAPSLGYLRREFNAVARKVIEVEEAAQPSWYDRQWSNVQYYLGWTAPQPGLEPPAPDPEPARAVLAEAANAINGGRFDQAVAAMAGLRGPGAEQAAQWIGAARARVAADQAVRGLSALALSQIHK